MLEIIKSNTSINFVSKFSKTAIISLILVAVSVFGIVTKLNYGVDFRGGAEIQIKFQEAVNLNDVRKTLKAAGFKGIAAQSIGELSENEFIVKVQGDETNLNEITEQVSTSLKNSFSAQGVEVRKVDIVGPKAGAQLRISGFQAMLWALIAIMIYIGLRFDFKYSPGAIFALFHDVTIILGVFSFCNIEFTLQTVAALLAVIGYSVNDTVIVYDRVREHEEKYADLPLSTHINQAVNETLSRTIMTSLTTLFVSVVMYSFGGLAIRDFFLAITLGVVIGTYSSIFVAAPITLLFDKFSKGDVEAPAEA
ncbi:protein-export membrane protein SecF [Halobacteriovorax marinus]|uniref:Protein-export membrane protein SecF n=1 Tax=Halobacteriovorax marinus TaxID=97084 RepID=A0A1Y5F8T6_9BACT|nr:protein-export membrane protein SecF [Halobacteriovorax marinus]